MAGKGGKRFGPRYRDNTGCPHAWHFDPNSVTAAGPSRRVCPHCGRVETWRDSCLRWKALPGKEGALPPAIKRMIERSHRIQFNAKVNSRTIRRTLKRVGDGTKKPRAQVRGTYYDVEEPPEQTD